MATSRIVEHLGRVLSDRYRLTRALGTGASAHVYVAEDVTLRRLVAVKLLHPGLADDEAFLRRFQAEARVVAALRHPNIVRVYDWGDDQGSPFIVMELLDGGSLRGLLDRGAVLSPAQAARVGAQTARALDYAHKRGLVHRDIKPANLLFDEEGQVSVADFGLARALAEATWTEPVGAMLGTARYAAPEQINGGGLDGRADVYALALVLVEAVTGRVPFAADTTIGTLMARVDRDLPVPEEMGPIAPAVAAAGTADPAARGDAAALAAALTAAARQLPPPAPLALVRETEDSDVAEDRDPTEHTGRSQLFDGEAPIWPKVPNPSPVTARAKEPRRPASPDRLTPEPPPFPKPRRKRRWLIGVLVVLALGAAAAGAFAYYRISTPKNPVPNLVGDSPAKATQLLQPLHLHLRVAHQTYNNGVPKGVVISQVPAATAVLREGSLVAVTVSLGPPPVPVPDLNGLSVSDATNRLIGAQLKLGMVTTPFNSAPKGTVLSWTGQGGQLPEGSAVNLVVSAGPPTVPVPAVAVGQSFASAQTAMAAVNLTAAETQAFSNTVPAGGVISSNPPAGTPIQVGSSVTFTVSKGPDLVVVPSVRGDSVGAASQALQGDGFNVSGVTGNPLNTVVRSSPAGGTKILRGSSVTLFTN